MADLLEQMQQRRQWELEVSPPPPSSSVLPPGGRGPKQEGEEELYRSRKVWGGVGVPLCSAGGQEMWSSVSAASQVDLITPENSRVVCSLGLFDGRDR